MTFLALFWQKVFCYYNIFLYKNVSYNKTIVVLMWSASPLTSCDKPRYACDNRYIFICFLKAISNLVRNLTSGFIRGSLSFKQKMEIKWRLEKDGNWVGDRSQWKIGQNKRKMKLDLDPGEIEFNSSLKQEKNIFPTLFWKV